MEDQDTQPPETMCIAYKHPIQGIHVLLTPRAVEVLIAHKAWPELNGVKFRTLGQFTRGTPHMWVDHNHNLRTFNQPEKAVKVCKSSHT